AASCQCRAQQDCGSGNEFCVGWPEVTCDGQCQAEVVQRRKNDIGFVTANESRDAWQGRPDTFLLKVDQVYVGRQILWERVPQTVEHRKRNVEFLSREISNDR